MHLVLTNIPRFLNFDDEDNAMDSGGKPAFQPTDARDILNVRNTISYSEKEGASTNVNGNVKVSYDLGNIFHRCIAKKYDARNNSVIYFLWSADGKHKIMRYHRQRTDTTNPYGVIEKVLEYNFRWKQRTKITAINLVQDDKNELLYWVDNIMPRMLNLTKASTENKTRCWDLYLPKRIVFPPFLMFRFAITALDINGNPLPNSPPIVTAHTVFVTAGATPKDKEDAFTEIAFAINNVAGGPVTGSVFTAEACDCHLKICTTDSRVQSVRFTLHEHLSNIQYPTLAVPENWYGVDLQDFMFDQGKYPSGKEPICTFGRDDNFQFNYVKNKVWQFRLLYRYDNFEDSVYGVISNIPTDNIVCNDFIFNKLNYVDVDFNDSRLLDAKRLVILKEVAVCVRETNEGVWKEVERLPACEFFDINSTKQGIVHYRFYNNINPKPIAVSETSHPFDAIAIKPVAQEFIRNRLVHGGMLQDATYDKPECSDIKVIPVIDEDITALTYEISVLIKIHNPYLTNYTGLFTEPIFHNKGREGIDFPFYGGGSFNSGGTFGIKAGMEDKYQQILPDGVFTLYAANTDYVFQSRQVNVGLPTTKDGALLIGNANLDANVVNKIGQYIKDQIGTPGAFYSVAKLRVPDGTYVLRMASPWVSDGDKLQKGEYYDLRNGRLFHKTSCPIYGTAVAGGPVTAHKEIKVVVNGGDVFAGEFIVTDLSEPWYRRTDGSNSMKHPVWGYLIDANGKVDEESLRTGVSIEKAYKGTDTGISSSSVFDDSLTSCFTDHNGFFAIKNIVKFPLDTETDEVIEALDFIMQFYQVNSTIGITNMKKIARIDLTATFAFNPGTSTFRESSNLSGFRLPTSLQDLYNSTLQAITLADIKENELTQLIVATSSENVRKECSSYIIGSALHQQGGIFSPLPRLSLVYEGGKTAITDDNGDFRLLAWGDLIGDGLTGMPQNFNNRTRDRLIWNYHAGCTPSYAGGVNEQLINFSAFGDNPVVQTGSAPYSPTSTLFIGSKVITQLGVELLKGRKRGETYRPAMVYYDELMRQCGLSIGPECYIPLQTEDLSKYDLSLPTGTYKHGRARLSFQIGNHKPLKEAAYYQIVLTRGKTNNFFLTWAINELKYVISYEDITVDNVVVGEFIETTFENGDSNMILLSIENITQYSKSQLDLNIPYSFTKGDRIRIMADRNKVWKQGLFDYEIISFKAPGFLVLKSVHSLGKLESGTLVQIYNARPQSENPLEDTAFFEIGDTFPCTAPGIDGNQHSVTSGILKGGDTWWRNRSIPVFDDAKNFVGLYEYFMECQSISDLYDSTDEDIGRIQVDDPSFREMQRPSLIRNSDQYLPGTKINGLNRFRSLNYTELDRQDGLIISLQKTDNILFVVQDNGMVSEYTERVIIQDAVGQEFLATSKTFFGTENRLQKDFGAQFADGIFRYEDFIYGFDSKRGIEWRRANNGVDSISKYKARNYFRKYAKIPIWDCTSVYHREFEHLIITIWKKQSVENLTIFSALNSNGSDKEFQMNFPNGENLSNFIPDLTTNAPSILGIEVEIEYTNRLTNLKEILDVQVVRHGYGSFIGVWLKDDGRLITGDKVKLSFRGEGDTIAFSEPDNKWATRYNFRPEGYAPIADEIVSWVDGELWIHDKNPIKNNFYGVQYTSKIKTIFNANREVKMWLASNIDSKQDNGGNDWSVPVITTKNGQLSRIEKASYMKGEEYWHSQMYRDLNSPGVTDPILNGSYLRASALTMEFENDYTGEFMLKSLSESFEISERNTK